MSLGQEEYEGIECDDEEEVYADNPQLFSGRVSGDEEADKAAEAWAGKRAEGAVCD